MSRWTFSLTGRGSGREDGSTRLLLMRDLLGVRAVLRVRALLRGYGLLLVRARLRVRAGGCGYGPGCCSGNPGPPPPGPPGNGRLREFFCRTATMAITATTTRPPMAIAMMTRGLSPLPLRSGLLGGVPTPGDGSAFGIFSGPFLEPAGTSFVSAL